MSSEQSNRATARVGILGLGRMGRAMAARLTGQGFAVAGWTRSGITTNQANAWGIAAHDTAAAVAAASDMVLLSLSDDAAVAEIVGQLGRGDLAGKLIVDTSTVSPDTLRRLAGAIGEAGGAALDAPVSGGPDLVLAGKAGFYIGGAQATSSDSDRWRKQCPTASITSARWAKALPPSQGAGFGGADFAVVIRAAYRDA